MNRIWRPIDIAGLRLYKVILHFPTHPDWRQELVVAARSPRNAVSLIVKAYENTAWIETPVITGQKLNVYQPAEWWDEGISQDPAGDGEQGQPEEASGSQEDTVPVSGLAELARFTHEVND